MDNVHIIPTPVPTTAIVSSFAEAMVAAGELAFPLLAVPFGAETHGTPAWLFQNSADVTQEALDILLLEAVPVDDISKVHLISVATSVLNAPWQHLLAKNGPRVDIFFT